MDSPGDPEPKAENEVGDFGDLDVLAFLVCLLDGGEKTQVAVSGGVGGSS